MESILNSMQKKQNLKAVSFCALFVISELINKCGYLGLSVAERLVFVTNTTSQKCTKKTSSQHNATWQSDSQRAELEIPSGAQLYYKRFWGGIQISGSFW
jgi:hypothetical protein